MPLFNKSLCRLIRPWVFPTTFSLASVMLATAAQGSDDSVGRIVVFGDSLADGGYYSWLLGLPGSQSFTTNPDPVAPEVFAAELGLSLLPAYGENGTNFATGGARVTAANSASIPIATQLSNFLAAGGQFSGNDLVYVQGGGNDFFAFAAGGGVDSTILTTAAEDLAALVSTIQNAGAPRIVTMAVQTGGNPGLALFNSTYEAALAERGVNALYFDTDALFNEMVVFADQFGFTSLDPACGGVSSLACTPSDWLSPDANETHLLADDVHPGGKAQRIQGQAIASLLVAPAQIGQLSYAGQALFRNHRSLNERAYMTGLDQGADNNVVFGKLAGYNFRKDGSLHAPGLDEDGAMASVGLDHRLASQTNIGIFAAISQGDGEFEHNRGNYDVDAASAGVYARAMFGEVQVHADLMIGRARYDSLTRYVQLGPVRRAHEGETEADFLGLGVSSSKQFSLANDFVLVPRIGLDYQTLEVDGYGESNSFSTGARFGDQELDSLNGLVGLTFRNDKARPIHFYVDGQFNYEFNDDDRDFTVVPSGAPISYTSELQQADREFFSFNAGVDFRLDSGLVLQAGVAGTARREDLEQRMLFVGSTFSF